MAHRPRPRAPVQTLDRQTPHERSKQSHNFTPSALRKRLPKSRTELDVLVEHHKFIREVREGAERQETEEKLSWEDELAEKFYATLFREFAVVNLKHFKSHQIALRWRNEDEVLSSIGQRTCGHLRCRYHLPPPPATPSTALDEDEEDESPLVDARLYTFQVPFGYVEEETKKSALVKLVLCKECGKKLNYGRGKKGDSGKQSKEVEDGIADDAREGGEDDYAPARPPDLERENRDRNPSSTSRRRSASPPPRRQHSHHS